MKPDRILAITLISEMPVGDSTLFNYCHFSYEVETSVLKTWFTRGVKVHDQDATIAQHTQVTVLGSDIECYRFLSLLGKLNKEGKLVDVQFREGKI